MTPAEREKEREWKRSRELQKQERALKRKAEQVNMPSACFLFSLSAVSEAEC